MKTFTSSVFYLLLATILFSTIKVKAQALVPVGTKWYYGVNIYDVDPPDTYPFSYECIRLETRNNKTYSVIKYGDSLFYLRSDSGKVYQWVLSQDYLVFDFTKNVGDTIVLGNRNTSYQILEKYYTKNYSSTDSLLTFKLLSISYFPIYWVANVCEKILKTGGYTNHYLTDLDDGDFLMGEINFRLRCFDIPTIADSFHLTKPGTPCDYKGKWFLGAELGIKEITQDKSLKVFPNPVTDVLTISSEKIISNIDFFNLEGRKVLSIPTHDNSISINLHLFGLKNGLYLLTIKSGEDVSHIKILVK
jgi:hypothetical protein